MLVKWTYVLNDNEITIFHSMLAQKADMQTITHLNVILYFQT